MSDKWLDIPIPITNMDYIIRPDKECREVIEGDGVLAYYRDPFANAITLSENVKRIRAGAFSDCKSICSVIIPSTVEFIEAGAFKDCSSLNIVSLSNDTYIDGELDDVFVGCGKITIIIRHGNGNCKLKIKRIY